MTRLFFSILLLASAGCTTLSLQRHAVNQSQSAADYRYHAALHALAMVANSPDTLPSFALLSNGVTAVLDTGIINPATNWAGATPLFASEALAFTGNRTPVVNWTVDPVADYTQLEAMRCACRWVLAGPNNLGAEELAILADPELDSSPGAHFGVADRLAHLPKKWFHIGPKCCVPPTAYFKDHCGDTWIWVMPSGSEGLAGFTLVLQDIATLNVAPADNSMPANIAPPVLVTLWVVDNALPTPPPAQVTISIVNKGGMITYRKAGDQINVANITVGQAVEWVNTDISPHSATTNEPRGPHVFDTSSIPPRSSSGPIIFDSAIYAAAGGDGTHSVPITYSSSVKGDKVSAPAPVIVLTPDPTRALYAPTLVSRVDRVVKPSCKSEIEKRLADALRQGSEGPLPAVTISWQEWQDWTDPYQGQRTGVKPGAQTNTPVLTGPVTRSVAPPSRVLQLLRIVETGKGGFAPPPVSAPRSRDSNVENVPVPPAERESR